MIQTVTYLLIGSLFSLAMWKGRRLVAQAMWSGIGLMTQKRSDDPIYKANVRRLIERNRRFEESKE